MTHSLLPKTHQSNPKTVLGVGLARDGHAAPRMGKAEGEMCTDSNARHCNKAPHVHAGITGRIRIWIPPFESGWKARERKAFTRRL